MLDFIKADFLNHWTFFVGSRYLSNQGYLNSRRAATDEKSMPLHHVLDLKFNRSDWLVHQMSWSHLEYAFHSKDLQFIQIDLKDFDLCL